MAPRKASASAAAPSASAQPKSSRQQFTACGACRMRRVKCDLKTRIKELEDADKDISHASCSNCMERNLKCIDENAEIKTQKLLRRGRRLQQVAAIYGKDVEYVSPRMPSASTSSCIPTLQRELFDSHFYRAFSIQYPILDSAEFAASYDAYLSGNRTALTLEGQLCAKILVIWAASFGVDPSGTPTASGTTDGSLSSSPQLSSSSSSSSSSRGAGNAGRQRVKEMLREALSTVDVLGVMRKPSWDGVRALMLLLPLVEGAQPTSEQITMRETMMNQVHTLCTLSKPSKADYTDSLARARLFWYAYVYEGVHTALRGGRLVLDEDDLAAFQRTLPPFSKTTTPSARATSAASPTQAPSPAASMASSSPSSSSSSPLPSPSPAPPSLLSSSSPSRSKSSPATLFHNLTQIFTVPLRASATCRIMHAALLGPKAVRRNTVDEEALVSVWAGLARCWDELEGMRMHAARSSSPTSMGVANDNAAAAGTERFVARWQLFVFQCHNVIREVLHQRRTSLPPPTAAAASIEQLYMHATAKCASYLPRVLDTLHFHHQRAPVLGFLAYDAACAPDAAFYAGLSLAQRDASTLAALDGSTSTTAPTSLAALEEGVSVCLTTLQGSRWVFGQRETEHRVGAIRLAWGEVTRRGQQHQQFLSQHQQRQAIEPQHVQEVIPMKLEPGGPEISLDAYTTAPPPPPSQHQQQFLFEVSAAVAPSAQQHQQPHHHHHQQQQQQQAPMSLSISIPPSSAQDGTMLASAVSTMDDGTLSSAATAMYTRFYTPPLTGSSSSASSSPTIELFHQYQPSPEQQHHSQHQHHAQAHHALFSDPSTFINAADGTTSACGQLDQSGTYGYGITDTSMPHHHPYHAHAHDPSPGMDDSSSIVSAYPASVSLAPHDPTQQYGGLLYAPEPAYAMS